MLLSREEKKQLIARFPSLELSYENVLHKKVYADVYVVIPSGKKAFVWFTYWQDKNVCFVLFLNDKNNICDIKPYPVCFDKKLSLNTVIYGTVFSTGNTLAHFSCEQLFYYKGINTINSNSTFTQQLSLFKDMFETDIKQVAYTTDFLILGLPIMKTNFEHALACINGLSYNVSGIAFYNVSGNKYNNNNILGIYKINKPTLPEAVFQVKALLDADMYELYYSDDVKCGIAMIPSYKCSVMMNSLFRNIKENMNLDLLEESDGEEEYENNSEDKFVNLTKSYNMRCVYNKKFKKWQPVEVTDAQPTFWEKVVPK